MELNFFKKNQLLAVVITSAVVAALVGGAFGYYSAQNGISVLSGLRNLIEPKTNNNFVPATSEEAKVISVVNRASPAVVSIVATKDLTIIEQQAANPFQSFCDDPFFRQFLGDQCNAAPQPSPRSRTQKQQVAAGSGFIISSDGLILTNRHVVNIPGADFTVITSDNKKYPGKVLAKDPVQDIALVKISAPNNFVPLTLGNSSKLQTGQTVIAIGNALGQFSNSVSKGVISGLSRSIVASEGGSSEKLNQVIQTDAAINPGNSGGPLLDLSGNVIGINTAMAQGAQNIGFAIPINQAKKDISQVKSAGKISYPYLGINYVLITDELKQQNNLPVNYGALITKGASGGAAVVSGSPADKAGIKENDVILEINGQRISTDNDLAEAVQSRNVGDTITLKILSQGKERTASLKLEERPQSQ